MFSPEARCDSLSVRSGLLSFGARHRIFRGLGRFLGQNRSISAFAQALFSRATFGNSSVRFANSVDFDPKSRGRAKKCDGGRRKRVTQPTHKADT